ncbi:MAG: DNA polymerase III subunit gamma/tau [Desulfobacterota bacterium]|nr:DNA polymerase III subunit gamma/tau [Thermodesulfobacteriota bacterium]
MAYKVLARKFRPQTFGEVIGQTHVTRTLVNSIREGRIAHAFLFAGERGVGKTSVARILAKALNCHTGLSDQPCGTCPSCIEIAAGTCIDVHEIDGASNRGVDDIRTLRENVRYLPTRDRYKIYIIDEVHMLTEQAFNALLKTLEEPPSHVVFILATTEPHKIPDTIISRCLRFDFRRIPTKEIIAHLEQIARQEHISITRHGLYLIAREAEGSMRDAQSILERAVSYCGSQIEDHDLQDMLGHIDRRQLFNIMEGIIAGDPHACIDGIARLYDAGVDLKRWYYAFLELLRDIRIIKMVPDQTGLVEASDEDLRQIHEAAERISDEGLQRCFRLWFSAENDIVRSANPKIALEVCLLEMLQVKESVPIDELLSTIEHLQQHLERSSTGSRAVPLPAQPRPAPAAPAPRSSPRAEAQVCAATPSEPSGEELIAFIARTDAKFAAYLRQACITIEDGKVTVAFPEGDIFLDIMKEAQTEQKLNDLCRSFLQRNVTVTVQTQPGGEKKNRNLTESPDQIKRKREQQVLHNPVVQQVLKTFNGKIVAIHPADR